MKADNRPNYAKLTQNQMRNILYKYNIRVIKNNDSKLEANSYEVFNNDILVFPEHKVTFVEDNIKNMLNDISDEIIAKFDEADLDNIIHKLVALSSLTQLLEEQIRGKELSPIEMKELESRLLNEFNTCVEAKYSRAVVPTESPIKTATKPIVKPQDIASNNAFDYTKTVSSDSIVTVEHDCERNM